MNDLLHKAFSRGRGDDNTDLEAAGGSHGVEMQEATDQSAHLSGFFEEVGAIRDDMDKIKLLLEKLKEANEESKIIHKAPAMKGLRERMERDVTEVSRTAKSIRDKLEQLDRSNAASRKVEGCEENSLPDRTRTTTTNGLRKKLKDYMDEFATLRSKIMGEYRETIERRYYTVTGQKPDENTLERIIETGESETFLQKAIQEQGRGQVLETIREIQERHDGVKEIEKNLLELHQIFLDMAVLVEAQGEQLNDIEAQVNRAQSFVSRGVTQLGTAKKLQRNTRKWTCIAIILLLIIIAIIVVPIAVKVAKN